MRYFTDYVQGTIEKTPLQKRPKYVHAYSRKWRYKDIICAFDIEVTNLKEERSGVMYIWQFALDTEVYYGRTWDEFLEFLDTLRKELKEKERLCVFIHNASYEFQFISGIYKFKPEEVFCVESRKILWFTMFDNLEFRCSYLQTGMSLRKFLQKMGVADQKLELDYSEERYSWTPMSEEELSYCENDVKGLVEAMKKEMYLDKDSLYTIPMTSTGYVRRDAKKALRNTSRLALLGVQPSLAVYELLREAFRGGNTHANRIYVGKILKNVYSHDIVSSYPTVMMEEKYPTIFRYVGDVLPDRILYSVNAWIARFSFENIRLKGIRNGAPYLSVSRCGALSPDVYEDNGRVLRASKLQTTLTEIDARIVFHDYDFDSVKVTDAYYARKKYLPKEFLSVISSYYDAKTRLKGVDSYYYMKAKNKLNALYGMTAQNPVKEDILYVDGEYTLSDKSFADILKRTSNKAFLPYQVGVWVTAYARWRLQEAIWAAGDSFVYCDTDSVKTLGEFDMSKINAKAVQRAKRAGAFSIKNDGTVSYMGVYELDGVYEKFRTWGAKKYCYVEDGKLTATIAGVVKDLAPKELGSIENFAPPFEFQTAGGVAAVFNDVRGSPRKIEKEGHELELTSNIYLYQDTYKLSVTDEYSALLSDPTFWLRLRQYILDKAKIRKEIKHEQSVSNGV